MALLDRNESAELIVLSLLSEGAKYGYLLAKEAAARSEGKLRLTPGVLYPLLKQLERGGLITSTWDECKADDTDPDEPGRRRKWYRLGAKGRKRLEQRIVAHRDQQAMMDVFIRGSRASANAAVDGVGGVAGNGTGGGSPA